MKETFSRKEIEGIKTEIGAGRVMIPKNEADRAYNQGCSQAMHLIQNYLDGRGLFSDTPLGVEP